MFDVNHVHILTIPVCFTIYFLVFNSPAFQLPEPHYWTVYCPQFCHHNFIPNSMCSMSSIFSTARQVHWKWMLFALATWLLEISFDGNVWTRFVPQFTHNCNKLTKLSFVQGSAQKGEQFIFLPTRMLSSAMQLLLTCSLNRFRFPIHAIEA